jgi:hypothetical protein
MRISIDATVVEVPAAATLAELLDGVAPLVDPGRLVTELEVDGAAADPSDRAALLRRRLTGAETVVVGTEDPVGFATRRRREIPGHLRRIAALLTVVADGLARGQAADANTVLASASRELGLVLELDRRLAVLVPGPSPCDAVEETVQRIGAQLTAAESGRRWAEVAQLLTDELVPALQAG